ncbi:MAG: hypothetical protein QGG24_01925 [Vicinamibacterales bacterium]|jgi:hypothetical protein|nr:hypothetical protein [Vicinamibacterales bacterium]MDP7473167.1 hypothetical protein [Vicinamibacterales bacterium]MDP7672094.1 hypothetical protein [Vicinamibacterales bacterium]HJO39823.1 hypothetical protein [Vicinamibacterales bacterium]|tara:strand:+ start:2698 stop:3171 length:474 start_codon:yes stop_codon:yes gene_type:complete
MAAALLTGTMLSVLGLAASVVLGHMAIAEADISRHVSLAVFVTMITLLSHSMLMFYMIGKGKAVREAAAEGGLSPKFAAEVSRVRRPIFSLGMLAIALTIVAAVIGAGVDTQVLPSGFHALLGYSAVASNVAALRVEYIALATSARIVDEVNRLLDA